MPKEMQTSKIVVYTLAYGILCAVFTVPTFVQAQTGDFEDMQRTLSEIRQQAQQIQSQLNGNNITLFTRNLTRGDRGPDVLQLQKTLNNDVAGIQVANSGPGSVGQETTYFGTDTYDAVVAFQEKYAQDILAPVGLQAGTGYVGPSTRSKLNQLTAVNTNQTNTKRSTTNTQDTRQAPSNTDTFDTNSFDTRSFNTRTGRQSGSAIENLSGQSAFSNTEGIQKIRDGINAQVPGEDIFAQKRPPAQFSTGCNVNAGNMDSDDKAALERTCSIIKDAKSILEGEKSMDEVDYPSQFEKTIGRIQDISTYARLRQTGEGNEGEVELKWDINNMQDCTKDASPTIDAWSGSVPVDTKTVGEGEQAAEITYASGTRVLDFNATGSDEIQEDLEDMETFSITCQYESTDYTDTVNLNETSKNPGNAVAYGDTPPRMGTQFGRGGALAAAFKSGALSEDRNVEDRSVEDRSGRYLSSSNNETKLAQIDPPDDDVDVDGVKNKEDNCPNIFNPLQSDEDDDDVGNACDPKDNSKDKNPTPDDEKDTSDRFIPFAGQNDNTYPCTCWGWQGENIPWPGLMIGIDDSLNKKYDIDIAYIPLATTLHRHYEFISWRWPERCVLGNYNQKTDIECKQINPAHFFGYGPLCITDPFAPDEDGFMFQIGTSEEEAKEPYCGENTNRPVDIGTKDEAVR